MNLRIESFEDANETSNFVEHLDPTYVAKSENSSSSSFDSDCYDQNKNHKSLEDELAEIEIEFQNIRSKYTFCMNQISNEKSFQSNKFDALENNEYLNDKVNH